MKAEDTVEPRPGRKIIPALSWLVDGAKRFHEFKNSAAFAGRENGRYADRVEH